MEYLLTYLTIIDVQRLHLRQRFEQIDDGPTGRLFQRILIFWYLQILEFACFFERNEDEIQLLLNDGAVHDLDDLNLISENGWRRHGLRLLRFDGSLLRRLQRNIV